jgi:hypothetical protein
VRRRLDRLGTSERVRWLVLPASSWCGGHVAAGCA